MEERALLDRECLNSSLYLGLTSQRLVDFGGNDGLASVAQVESQRGLAEKQATADLSTPCATLRSLSLEMRVGWKWACYPKSPKRDLGHPVSCGEASSLRDGWGTRLFWIISEA